MSGSGSRQDAWPTLTVHGNNNFKGASTKSGDGLMTVIKRRKGYPTPTARDAKPGTARPHGGGRKGRASQTNLNDLVLRWPTPCASGDLHYRLKGGSQVSKCLAVAVYPTPTAHDRHGYCPSELRRASPNLSAVAARFDTSTVHGDGGSGRKGTVPKYSQLNPDWEEWLMAWPVGWTDIETPNIRLVWLDPSIDPADYGEIPCITNRRDNRPARVKEIGNGQFPLAAAVAFDWGLCVLEAAV